ncbi:protein NRT1/ PTR FAMILY 5.10-like [Coffea eugenioides]|uniref:protein NRT1/ PTR FAMILY 5.10-like n=1 Tax=Coffea eugenioides TaxID=49369 RepID=UPI000F60B350|nr:protein NRT1/ PTR FAMILY 5.10-like [Coffea eugenioides]
MASDSSQVISVKLDGTNLVIGKEVWKYVDSTVGKPTEGTEIMPTAATVNTWIGVVSLVPVFRAFLADSFLGLYRSVIFASILYISVGALIFYFPLHLFSNLQNVTFQGLRFLTLSATITPIVSRGSTSPGRTKNEAEPDMHIQILFFGSLYLVALAQGYSTFLQAFGGDQFDGKRPEESKAKSSFFNWWLGVMGIGPIAAHLILNYIQDNISWEIGSGIPCLAMIVGLILLLLGRRTYQFSSTIGDEGESPCSRITKRFAKGISALHIVDPASSSGESSQNYMFLNGELPSADDDSTDNNATSSITKEIKQVLRLHPIWITSLSYAIAYAQA